jgi:nitrite reductase/ring-hydroxylating ferredoxin subunit
VTTHRVPEFTAPDEGDLGLVHAADRDIAVTVVDGQLYAFDDECTHAQCSLSEGEIEGRSVLCPCHFGQFDITTGKVVSGPPERPLRTYPVRLVGTTLDIDLAP